VYLAAAAPSPSACAPVPHKTQSLLHQYGRLYCTLVAQDTEAGCLLECMLRREPVRRRRAESSQSQSDVSGIAVPTRGRYLGKGRQVALHGVQDRIQVRRQCHGDAQRRQGAPVSAPAACARCGASPAGASCTASVHLCAKPALSGFAMLVLCGEQHAGRARRWGVHQRELKSQPLSAPDASSRYKAAAAAGSRPAAVATSSLRWSRP